MLLEMLINPTSTLSRLSRYLSKTPLPDHCLKLAQWLAVYYAVNFGEALGQFAPSRPVAKSRLIEESITEAYEAQLEIEVPLTKDQSRSIKSLLDTRATTTLLHGETGSGKTRVYIELAKDKLEKGQSVILLTPEIALTSQLAGIVKSQLANPIYIFHSQLTQAKRRKIWLSILESAEPVIVIGPRSALFSPVKKLGLIILDEAHEPAYKQDQTPRYNANRVASQLGYISGAKVVLGTATPSVNDYYVADQHGSIVRMKESALTGSTDKLIPEIIDIKDRTNFTNDNYFSNQLIESAKQALSAKRQVMIYLNRRGSARQILCNNCGWQMLCPNCDIPLVYHGDEHAVRCHTCGFQTHPPTRCPQCHNYDIIYRGIGTKALIESVRKLFPDQTIKRFDSDNIAGERLNDLYAELKSGKINIVVGTQLLAKGLDLPHLGLVGIISAETSAGLPDFSSDERSFQLLYQVIGRVGRGHVSGRVILQSYNPGSQVLKAAANRDYKKFYEFELAQRKKFRFPPFSYQLQLICRRATAKGAENAAQRLKSILIEKKLPVEIIGPTPNFYVRRGRLYYWQLIIKSKNRSHLIDIANTVPQGWSANLDPVDLL